MSEYADIGIKNMSLAWFRNYLEKDVVELFFSRDDLSIEENYVDDPEDEDSQPYTRYIYQTSVKKAKERLDAMGYGTEHFEELFNQRVLEVIDYDPFLHHLRVDIEDFDEKAQDRIKKYITFKKWINSLDRIVKYELEHGEIAEYSKDNSFHPTTECDKLIYYALKDAEAESFYSLNTEIINRAYIYRQILESCSDEDSIILDFSNLDYWAEDCIPKAIEATGNAEKIIVLVEGSSDKDILEFALSKIYPHLADLFYFMNFTDGHGNNRPGGTSEIRKQMEVFYYSKLRAKFIDVFDNDAVGYQSKHLLLNEKIKIWPENFRILCYPQIPFFRKYPTIAPNGKLLIDDINRKACSIELYLPDKLIMSEGILFPIEWESRQTIKKTDGVTEFLYQGVISNKDTIKERFHDMKNKINNGKEVFIPQEWERMKLLLDDIVFAFK